MNLNNNIIAMILLFLTLGAEARISEMNRPPQITNLKAYLNEKSKKLIVTYDLADTENDPIKISLKVNSKKSNVEAVSVKGDIGYPINAGKQKKIVWKYQEGTELSKHSLITLTADDQRGIDVAEIIDQIDTARMMKDLSFIYGERNSRSEPAKRHLEKVRDYMEKNYADFGLSTRRQILALPVEEVYNLWDDQGIFFDSINWAGNSLIEVQNIEGELPGASDEAEVIIVSAHYDSFLGSPGLDDNASGVVGMLEVMKVLSRYRFNKTIKFVGFDKEEDGLIGSLSYVFKGGLKETDDVAAVLNFDMIGVCSNQPNSQMVPEGFELVFPQVVQKVVEDEYRGNFAVNITNANSLKLNDLLLESRDQINSQLKIATLTAIEDGRQIPTLAASDHASFWYGGIPAVHIGEGGWTRNQHIHTEMDSKEQIDVNLTFMRQIISVTINSIIEMAELRHGVQASCTPK